MIASWMLYTAAVGALMTIAALALDRAFAARGRATRGIWAAAVTSLKVEDLGPFHRPIADVEALIHAKYNHGSGL